MTIRSLQEWGGVLGGGIQRVKVGWWLYLVLGAGGLWHILHVFQAAMRILASPIIIGIAVWIAWEYRSVPSTPERRRFTGWSLLVFAGSLGVEALGVRTGRIFGVYSYGRTLHPFVDRVPLSIGFAWLEILVSATAVAQRVLKERFAKDITTSALFISLLVLIFDVFMESGAVKLGYWQWKEGRVPLQNYAAWLLLSFLFLYPGLRIGLFRAKVPIFAFHAYFSQVLYFGLVNAASPPG